MLNRREAELAKPYIGNILLYDFIATQRAPVFLRRNIKQFLYANQQELEAKRGSTSTTVETHLLSRANWKFPPEAMVRQFEDQKAFVAVIKALKPLSENGKLTIDKAETRFVPLRIRCQFGLSVWDPDSAVVFCKPSREAEISAVRTKDGANVFEVNMRENFREPIARWMTPGKVDENTKYEAQLSLNFLNSEDAFEFLDHVQPGRWTKRGDIPTRFIAKWLDLPQLPEKGRLLHLRCSSDNAVTQIGVEIAMYWSAPRGQTVLMEWNEQTRIDHMKRTQARMDAIAPVGPPKFQVLYQYSNGRQPGLGVSTRRTKVQEIRYDSLKCRHCNYPKFDRVHDLQLHLYSQHSLFDYGVEEEDPTKENLVHVRVTCTTAIRTVYSFPKMQKVMALDGIQCPHCHQDSFGSVQELLLHLDHLHDKFNYKFQEEVKTDDGKLELQFEGTLDQSYVDRRASDHVPDDHDVSIIAPDDLFDLNSYQGAEHDEWLRRARLQKPKPRARPQARSGAGPAAANGTKRGVKRKLPDDVAPRPQHVKKLYKVPVPAEGITLFRTSTKRVLEPGEYVSESDDEVDMTWFKLKKAAHIMSDETGIPPEARPFVKYWDENIMEEMLTSDLFVGDALIRFTQKTIKDNMLQNPQFLSAFRKKLEELSTDKLITPEIHTHVQQIIDNPSQDGTQDPPPPKRVRFPRQGTRSAHSSQSSPTASRSRIRSTSSPAKSPSSASRSKDSPRSKGKARMTSHGQTTPQNTDSDNDIDMPLAPAHPSLPDTQTTPNSAPQHNLCVCGADAEAGVYARKVVWCENPFCVRHCFHLDCVAAKWQLDPVPDPKAGSWFCPSCR